MKGSIRAATRVVGVCLSLLATTARAEPPSAPLAESPLIAYALELTFSEDDGGRDSFERKREVDHARYELEKSGPPHSSCASTLGASRFAQNYSRVGTALRSVGEFDESLRAYKSALACAPRSAAIYAELAWLYIHTGKLDAARLMIDRGIAINPDDHRVSSVRPRVDFLQERWADATARFRLAVVAGDSYEDNRIPYFQTYYWLAQRRAGVRTPQLVELPPADKDDADDNSTDDAALAWPAPILDTLMGRRTEAQLVQDIRDTDWEPWRRRRLTEALFYVGELRLAEGEIATARRCFAAVESLKVADFVEFAMARAELVKLQERAPR